MASSRIFIRGLPPSLSSDDFTKHFSSRAPITDARFFPDRRIGYVGYQTVEDAAKAVKYFNKSYIRMSRLAVEMARPVDDGLASNPRPAAKASAPPAVVDGLRGLKRKRHDPVVEEDAKLDEFLELMQPSSKSRTWADEQAPTRTPTIVSPLKSNGHARADHDEDGGDDETYEELPGRSLAVSSDALPAPPPPPPIDSVPDRPSAADSPQDTASTSIETAKSRGLKAVSDSDWLRSRTSRLLGLVDEDVPPRPTPDATDQTEPKPLPTTVPEDAKHHSIASAASAVPENEAAEASVPEDSTIDRIKGTGRLFLRNLAYSASEDDIRRHFDSYGSVREVHVTRTSSGDSKGLAYVEYEVAQDAVEAYENLDGTVFQGRLMHLLPAAAKKENKLDEFAISQLPLKKQRHLRKKMEAATSTFNWNALYMNSNAVMASVADRLGVAKADLFDPTSADAAVKQAHSETHLIQETKAYFAANGVNLDSFKRKERGDTAILVKNFPYGTSAGELKTLFEEDGPVSRMLMPPTGTIAIVEFAQPSVAQAAFRRLAYRRFKESVLFLEKAPKGIFDGAASGTEAASALQPTSSPKAAVPLDLGPAVSEETVDTMTLFVRNLNFATTTERLREVFAPLDGFVSARVKTKADPKRAGATLSMGFGFVDFESRAQAQAALAAMNDYNLDGHKLLVRASHKALDAAEERRREDRARKLAGRRTKIIIKNLPFEASKKDVRALFGSYGQLRSVRVPKKFDSSARGFAFADFVSAREAEHAMAALGDTHLLGRRLVLEFATADAVDAEEEIEKMQAKVGRQANRVALQKLTGSGRKKFILDGDQPDQDVD